MSEARPWGLWAAWMMWVPTLPLLALQVGSTRKSTPRLPEAEGARRGSVSGAGQPFRIAVLGESTAVGVGAARHTEALPGFLASFLARSTGNPIHWQLVGTNGATVRRLRQSVRAESLDAADIAVVLLGVNDVFRMTSLKTWRTGIAELVADLRATGVKHIFFSQVPPIGRFRALPQPLRRVLGIRAALLDCYLTRTVRTLDRVYHCPIHFPQEDDHVATDGVHPSALGYEEWAKQLSRRVLGVEI